MFEQKAKIGQKAKIDLAELPIAAIDPGLLGWSSFGY
jgi:hypothetical protein